MTESEQRSAVVREALTWQRTPYAHRAKLKGVGVDCAFFPIAVYQHCGLIPADYEPPFYRPDFHLHRDQPIYLDEVLTFMVEVPTPNPGDFVAFKFGRTWAHGAIVIDWPKIIHSSRVARIVTLGDGLRDGELIDRKPRFFTLWHGAQV